LEFEGGGVEFPGADVVGGDGDGDGEGDGDGAACGATVPTDSTSPLSLLHPAASNAAIATTKTNVRTLNHFIPARIPTYAGAIYPPGGTCAVMRPATLATSARSKAASGGCPTAVTTAMPDA